MVTSRPAGASFPEGPPHALPISPVRLRDVVDGGLRLEASAFGIEARQTQAILRAAGTPVVPLTSPEFLVDAHNAFRFARTWVGPEYGVPFLSSSDIISLRPNFERYLSRSLTKNLSRLIVKPWDVLISCSGTVGNVAIASRTIAGKAVSQDVLRITAPDRETAGFLTAYLRSKPGRIQLAGASYGSVIVHIEPAHLQSVLVPDIPLLRRSDIGAAMVQAADLRDQANDLLDDADALLHERLRLPRLSTFKGSRPATTATSTRLRDLDGRFEASYHGRTARQAESELVRNGLRLERIDRSNLAKEIRAITKFRKRVYVETGGIPLLSSKQLFQVDPIDVKRLAKGAHTKDLEEIQLEENMVAVTCSGTIGRVQFVPRYMAAWTANQHAIRILGIDPESAGYLYAWLSSGYGSALIGRHAYGSVILEIDRHMLASVPVPIPDPQSKREIAGPVLRANSLRNEAWEIERSAIARCDELLQD